jgi:2-oxoglutarate dehydrogenase E1 component
MKDFLYNTYLKEPHTLDESWRQFFSGFDFARSFSENGFKGGHHSSADHIRHELAVLSLIEGYRSRGHLLSDTNPIRKRRDRLPLLSLKDYKLDEIPGDTRFFVSNTLGLSNATISEIESKLKAIYCQKIVFEFTHIRSQEIKNWLQDKIENRPLRDDYGLDIEFKKRILEKLNGAVIFEKFLHTKYVGQKRFSLEGGESTINALDAIIETNADLGVEEVVIGMAHRGRLNVLANIMGKTYDQIFNEFEGTAIPDLSFGSGDVKYHLGFSSQIQTRSGKHIQLKLAPNPSHLEAVDPVVLGLSRAKADLLYESNYDKILPVLIHGDVPASRILYRRHHSYYYK